MEEDRNVVSPAIVDRGTIGRSHEQRVVAEVPLHPRHRQRILPEQQHVVELHVFQLAPPLRERADEGLRDGGVATVVDPVTAMDEPHRLLGGGQLGLVLGRQRHILRPSPMTSRSGVAGTPSASPTRSCTRVPSYM